MSRPVLLDLFCKAGGATRGYQLAGFEVHGVVIEPQPRYVGERFFQADALEFVAEHGHEYDAIHASPPCQFASRTTRAWGVVDATKHPNLIASTREILRATGCPYVIENVVEARAFMQHPIVLCGVRFGLKVYRHRLFESSVFLWQPEHESHPERVPHLGRGASPGGYISVAGNFSDVEAARHAMGIDWMTGKELSQAIPPAYAASLCRTRRRAIDAAPRRREEGVVSATCKSCSAPIIWTVTHKGRRMPVDAEPVEGGNIVLRRDGDETIAEYPGKEHPSLFEYAGLRYVSHFSTCPESGEWRKHG